jgi:hypothetical protein
MGLFARGLPAQKGKNEQNDENQKQYLGEDSRCAGDDPEAEDARDDGDEQKGDGVI